VRWREFIEEENGRGSASRVNMFIGVIVGSFTIIYTALTNNLSSEVFAVYMLATGGVYGFGKWQESRVQTEEIRANSPNPSPPIIAPLGPTTTINVNGKPEGEVHAG
jgi:hypothetical protein